MCMQIQPRWATPSVTYLTDARHVGWKAGFLHCILTVFSLTSVGLEPKKKLKLVHSKKRFPDLRLLHEAFLSGSVSPENMQNLNMPQSPLQHILGQCYTTFSKAATSRLLPWSPGSVWLSHLCVWDVIGPVTVSKQQSFSFNPKLAEKTRWSRSGEWPRNMWSAHPSPMFHSFALSNHIWSEAFKLIRFYTLSRIQPYINK